MHKYSEGKFTPYLLVWIPQIKYDHCHSPLPATVQQLQLRPLAMLPCRECTLGKKMTTKGYKNVDPLTRNVML